jgi:signal peptide peptidase SppA
MKYAHVLGAVMSTPWAILDEKFDAIVAVLSMRAGGDRFTEEEIQERIGEKRARPHFRLFADSGEIDLASFEGQTFDAVISAAASSAGMSKSSKFVAVIPVYGIIGPKAAEFQNTSTDGTGIDSLTSQLRAAIANPEVKAIVMDFDSPGGSVYGVDELAAEISAARDSKKIIAQINPLCASAAYYLASQSSEIAMNPSAEVGSIGVRAMHQDISKALELRGVKVTNISAGKYKVEGNPYEPLTEEGLAFMQQRVNEYYDSFVKAVARGRDVKVSDVKNGFGQGRVVGAVEAKRLGMIDRVATMDETLQRLGVGTSKGKVSASIVVPKPRVCRVCER